MLVVTVSIPRKADYEYHIYSIDCFQCSSIDDFWNVITFAGSLISKFVPLRSFNIRCYTMALYNSMLSISKSQNHELEKHKFLPSHAKVFFLYGPSNCESSFLIITNSKKNSHIWAFYYYY